MKFIVAVDCEGLACVVGVPGEILDPGRSYEFACRQAVREGNAAAKALFEAGAEQVILWDFHDQGVNWDWDHVDKRCDILIGAGMERRWGVLDETFSGVLMVGFHPQDNTTNGVLAHSYSPGHQWVKINGVEVGEIAIEAALAGEVGVPAIFVASDDKGTAEAKRFLPWVETVETKRGLGWNVAISKHPERAANDIYEGVKVAVGRLKEMKTFAFESPMTIQLRYKRLEKAQEVARSRAGWKRIDAYTVERQVQKLSDWI